VQAGWSWRRGCRLPTARVVSLERDDVADRPLVLEPKLRAWLRRPELLGEAGPVAAAHLRPPLALDGVELPAEAEPVEDLAVNRNAAHRFSARNQPRTCRGSGSSPPCRAWAQDGPAATRRVRARPGTSRARAGRVRPPRPPSRAAESGGAAAAGWAPASARPLRMHRTAARACHRAPASRAGRRSAPGVSSHCGYDDGGDGLSPAPTLPRDRGAWVSPGRRGARRSRPR
jgi:hypothetical protein